MSLSEYITVLKERYQKYIDSIQWHIDTNKPQGKELEICKQRISDFKQIVNDLTI